MQQSLLLDDYNILEHIADISQAASNSLTPLQKKQYAAYYTPRALSSHMVSVANYQGGKLGDKGAGAGVLSAMAAAQHILSNSKAPCFISAYEIIPDIQRYLIRTYDLLKGQATLCKKRFDYCIGDDFLETANDILCGNGGDYDNIIINPPYYKIGSNSDINIIIYQRLGFKLPNIYSAFMLLSLLLLKPGGSLTALVPRSFFNGMYHKPFRRFIKQNFSIDSMTRYRSRSNLFKNDNVLQENVIVRFSNRPQASQISIFACDCPESPATQSMILPASLLLDNECDIFVLPADHNELAAYQRIRNLPHKLNDMGLSLSTGKVVECRVKQHLNSEGRGAMYIEAKCLDTTKPTYTKKHSPRSHGNALYINNDTSKVLIDAQSLVLLKRISSNSDRLRMNCTVLRRCDCEHELIALSNSIQYIHGESLDDSLALQVSSFLSSHDVELAMRAINGTTQINGEDIAMLRFPGGFKL